MPINGRTHLTGLIGFPVAHSLSPAMHNAAATDLGLNVTFVPLPVPPGQVGAAVHGLRALSFLGANVTIPHKQAVMPFLDEIDPAARAIGAVNTIVVREGMLTGYNTDWSGFQEDLAHYGVEIAGISAWVLGAGGSARAVIYALIQGGARVVVLARRQEQAEELRQEMGLARVECRHWADLDTPDSALPPARLIVNTTPLGMSPHSARTPWPEGRNFPPDCFVYDLVYNPAPTRLLQQAEAAGLRAANGLGMLLRQGAHAFQLWTGHRPNLAVMAAAIGFG